MATVVSPTTKTTLPYPAADVAAVLQDELLNSIRRRHRRKGLALPKDDAEVAALPIEIDSLTVVEALSSLDDILPFKATEAAVKAGGYSSIEAAVKHVTGRVETQWSNHHGGGKP